jgi:hypothetical protein
MLEGKIAGPRFELGLTVSETAVLPLDDPAILVLYHYINVFLNPFPHFFFP